MSWKCIKLHYWPWITCIWFVTTIVVTYFISIIYSHVHPVFPFISDTGSLPPESCIFGQLMNIGAVLLGINVYVRHRQVNFAIHSNSIELKKIWNRMALICGIISCCGISMVANFQETSILIMHVMGSVLAFGVGSLYLILQTRITFAFRHVYKEYPEFWVGPKMLCVRIIITVCFCLLYCVVALGTFLAILKFKGKSIICWTEKHSGYQEHLVAAIAEWIMVPVFFIYLLSFSKEFKSLEYEEIRFNNKCAKSTTCPQEAA